MEHIHLIFNPIASSSGGGRAEEVCTRLSRYGEVVSHPTQFSGHAGQIAGEIAQDHPGSIVVVLGGDGTANEVAGALVETDNPLLPLPGGSTSVFARSLGCPKDWRSSLGWAERALARREVQAVDVGMMGDRPFLFAAGFGLDADTAHRVDQNPEWKRRMRGGFFAWTALGLLKQSYIDSGIEIRASWPGGEAQGVTLLLHNGPVYSYLGRQALIFDSQGSWTGGQMGGIMIRNLSGLSSAALAAQIIAGDVQLDRNPDIIPVGPFDRLDVYAEPSAQHQVDGEALGEISNQTVLCRPHALRVLAARA